MFIELLLCSTGWKYGFRTKLVLGDSVDSKWAERSEDLANENRDCRVCGGSKVSLRKVYFFLCYERLIKLRNCKSVLTHHAV